MNLPFSEKPTKQELINALLKIDDNSKFCGKCNQVKPKTEFYQSHDWCKKCFYHYKKEKYEQNKEKIVKELREKYQKTKELIQCECGRILYNHCHSGHLKSRYHRLKMNTST